MDSAMRPLETRGREKRPKRSRARWLPLIVIAAALVGYFAFGRQYLTYDTLRAHEAWLKDKVAEIGPLAPLVFILVYAGLVAVSIPVGVIFTLAGGFLFGVGPGGLYSLVAATLGASLIFLIAQTSLGELMRQRAGPSLRKVEAGFRENAASYLLILRLVPLFPFWLVNLVPALFGMKLRTYVIVSFVGMAPGSFAFSWVGAGLDAFLKEPGLDALLRWPVLGPLVALSALALVPILYKRHKARHQAAP
jgi:uncharacterized membrane protein YdjX (TVP38/TMEM64 family)